MGGGISGLSIAIRLRQAGFPVALLEASQLGFGASTRNQGWLYSGGWFAPKNADLARQCYRSLEQTIHYCPDCVEPDHAGMFYILADDAEPSESWTAAWSQAGIPFEALKTEAVLEAIPHFSEAHIQAAWRLPDLAIRTDLLLGRLAKTAQAAGVEMVTGSTVAGLLKSNNIVRGVIAAGGEEHAASLVILATGGDPGLWSDSSHEQAGQQASFELVNLKTQLMAVEPGLCPQPFCLLDRQGFNHVPHAATSIFGSNRWKVVSRPHDVTVDPEETERMTQSLAELLPTWDYSQAEVVEWAGTSVQAMHLEQIEPGRATLPTVIDHETEPVGLKNLLSVFPGRASLWPQLAEMTLAAVQAKHDAAGPQIATPPWMSKTKE